jgi:heterotetrameric sarcosine oxidase gamma subunit
VISPALSRVVQRSALESAHAALGARWLAEDIHWPAGYGSAATAAEAEAAAVGRGARLAEIGPFDELLIRGPGALRAIAALAVKPTSATAGRVVAVNLRGEPWSAWILEQDEVLLLSPVGGSLLTTRGQELASDKVSAIEMSGARTSIRLAGLTAPAILAELCPADTTPRTMAPSDLIQAPLAGVRAMIVRQDALSEPGYTILIARDEALYVWDALRAIGAVHGLTAVGPGAVAWERAT